MLREFLGAFDQDKVQELGELIQSSGKIQDLYNEIQVIIGASKMAGLQAMEKLFSTWNKVIESVLGNQDFSSSLKKELNSMLDLAFELRNGLVQSKKEALLLQNNDFKSKYMNIMKIAIGHTKKVG